MNGVLGYQYDAVGNRLAMSSTLAAIPAGLWNYDANDRVVTDVSDAAGNVVLQAGIANQYDFENHLVQHGGIVYEYDGDGNRVSKTLGGVKTTYLVDDLYNPTGYAQVVEERVNGVVQVAYGYGPQRAWAKYPVSAYSVNGQGATPGRYYGYDGHGSVRQLTDEWGTLTDTYDYDAYGNLVNETWSPSSARDWQGRVVTVASNTMLFAGEQYDPDLGLYYNRARYLDVRSGRFWGMDTYEGDIESPASLHRYLYANASPVGNVDPSGNDTQDAIYGRRVHKIIGDEFEKVAGLGYSNRTINTILAPQIVPGFGSLRPDLVDTISGEVYEIKPAGDVVEAIAQVTAYIAILRTFDKLGRPWQYGFTYTPKQNPITLGPGVYAVILPTFDGVIPYKVVNLKALAAEVMIAGMAGLTITVSNAIMLETLCPVAP